MSSEPAESTLCPFCESEISATAKKCRYCGEWVARTCEGCGTPIRNEWAARGRCAECTRKERTAVARPTPTAVRTGKNKVAAAFFAMLLGGFGAHKFYLGRPGWGVLYLFFCWTFLPSLVALVEGISYLVTSEEEFRRKYG